MYIYAIIRYRGINPFEERLIYFVCAINNFVILIICICILSFTIYFQ